MKNNIFEIVSKLLLTNEKYISEDGKLLKTSVYSDVMNMDKDLLALLIANQQVKETFFVNVENSLVFDKQKFAWFIESKEFLPDSYTKYSNKIGLTHNGNFISKTNDVVLDFPYKDCLIGGGQEKDKQKRREILYNEVIASGEISKMLAPKVFTNAKRYTKDGIQENITLNENDNLIIKGNNLIALSSLLKRYEGKVKCIYIDPPYNTGNDSFNYNDSFNHSTWLVFMKNRLELARRLLSDDGAIFVQMDTSRNAGVGTSELPYLNILLDDIFGRENFIGHLHWKKKKQPSFLSRIAAIMESILVYAKDEKNVGKFTIDSISDNNKPIINASNPISIIEFPLGIRVKADVDKIKKGSYTSKSMTIEYLNDVYLENGRTINSCKIKANFRTTQENINNFVRDDLIFITANLGLRRDLSEEEQGKEKAITDLLLDWGQNQDADDENKKIFNTIQSIFSNPKPELLIKNLILSCTQPNDIVLDFFLGSGTTAAVAHKMNRRYIGIEQMDYIQDITVERMKKVIKGEQGGISESVKWQGGGSFVYYELLENSQTLINQILDSKENNINEIKTKIYSDNRIVPYISNEELINAEKEFDNLDLTDKKKALISLVDKNKLYVNYSDIDDEDFNISEVDKSFTNSFYRDK
ncbi:C-terminal truncated type III restriction-modification system: methylase [Mycoplasmopsis bovigenitalium]|uniref:C-terminal truncated type III restriction-modification system: methylase n=1 Tax=Mycoplasmopsis bovigenitalium TaxID=2112 RepID=A0A449A955_9BACT|nr:site-specific DNA-methyltransferase [Mycoplasmopsis bovigenitalium]VEU60720.1 C-terminal truncated type III restriction-modification system: methylase [Mycoplasmopsis bovigenitalium]